MTSPVMMNEELVELIMKGALEGDYSLIEEGKAHIEQLSNRVERLESKGHLCPNCGAFTSAALTGEHPPISRVDEYPDQ